MTAQAQQIQYQSPSDISSEVLLAALSETQNRENQIIKSKATGPTVPSVYANAEEGKGDPGILVSCSTIEAAIFGDPHDLEKISGARGIKARRGCIFGLLIRAKDNEEKRVEGSAM